MVNKVKKGQYYYAQWFSSNKFCSSVLFIYDIKKNDDYPFKIIQWLYLNESISKTVWESTTTNFQRLATKEEIDFLNNKLKNTSYYKYLNLKFKLLLW